VSVPGGRVRPRAGDDAGTGRCRAPWIGSVDDCDSDPAADKSIRGPGADDAAANDDDIGHQTLRRQGCIAKSIYSFNPGRFSAPLAIDERAPRMIS
jgi:hypothetical protein